MKGLRATRDKRQIKISPIHVLISSESHQRSVVYFVPKMRHDPFNFNA